MSLVKASTSFLASSGLQLISSLDSDSSKAGSLDRGQSLSYGRETSAYAYGRQTQKPGLLPQ